MHDSKAIEIIVDENTTKATAFAKPEITLKKAEVVTVEGRKKKVLLTAEGTGVGVGSFYISVQKRPPLDAPHLPGFYINTSSGGYSEFFNGGDADRPVGAILDNSPKDEDPVNGAFAVTLDMEDWPEGEYWFKVGATNRPAEGPYIEGSTLLKIQHGTETQQAISNIPSAIHTVVYMKEGLYACFPNLYVLPDGRFATEFAARPLPSHYDGTGQSHPKRISTDGVNWEPYEGAMVDRKWRTRNGDFVIATAGEWTPAPVGERGALEAQGKVVIGINESTVATWGGAETRRSSDGGWNWQVSEIPLPEGCRGMMQYLLGASHLVTSKGTRLTAVYGKRKRANGQPENADFGTEIYILRSEDDGATWTSAPLQPNGLEDLNTSFNETALVEAADGTLVAMMRSTGNDYLWQSDSKDGGMTWTPPRKTAIYGHPASLLRLSDGRLFCTYGYRKAPMGIRAVFSDDHGKTWDTENELIVRQDAIASFADVGYPSAVELEDGSVLLVYYITTDHENTHIASTKFRPAATAKATISEK